MDFDHRYIQLNNNRNLQRRVGLSRTRVALLTVGAGVTKKESLSTAMPSKIKLAPKKDVTIAFKSGSKPNTVDESDPDDNDDLALLKPPQSSSSDDEDEDRGTIIPCFPKQVDDRSLSTIKSDRTVNKRKLDPVQPRSKRSKGKDATASSKATQSQDSVPSSSATDMFGNLKTKRASAPRKYGSSQVKKSAVCYGSATKSNQGMFQLFVHMLIY